MEEALAELSGKLFITGAAVLGISLNAFSHTFQINQLRRDIKNLKVDRECPLKLS